MIRLIKLSSSPIIFEPILFEMGVNIILGEKVDESTSSNRKMNGVGKSMSIEFINFCLLKKKEDSRVTKIPTGNLSKDTQIILDLEINKKLISIIRTTGKPDNPIFLIEEKNIEFQNIDDALKYLSNLSIDPNSKNDITFRQLLNLLVRDERSEFKDIIQTFDTSKKNIPPDYTPHLYLFKINLEDYKQTKNLSNLIDQKKNYKKELKQKIESRYQSVSNASSELNGLKEEVGKINLAVDKFQSNEAFDSIYKDLIKVESEMETLRIQQKALKFDLKRINSLPEPERITDSDIEIIYDQFRQGLGDVIAKSLNQVKFFKSKIDAFQQTLVNSRKNEIEVEISEISEKLKILENNYTSYLDTIDAKGRFKNIKVAMSVLIKKNEELFNTKDQLKNYDDLEKQIKNLSRDKSTLIIEIEKSLERLNLIVKNFEKTILDLHREIMDNEKASFKIEVIDRENKKEIFNFEMRIDSDGSHSVERVKVFIYDMALLFDSHTRQRHPKFLIHDNIFDVDKDTLIQSLNFVSRMESLFPDFQYILTLNNDEVENIESNIKLSIKSHVRAEFTRNKRFIFNTSHSPYQEITSLKGIEAKN